MVNSISKDTNVVILVQRTSDNPQTKENPYVLQVNANGAYDDMLTIRYGKHYLVATPSEFADIINLGRYALVEQLYKDNTYNKKVALAFLNSLVEGDERVTFEHGMTLPMGKDESNLRNVYAFDKDTIFWNHNTPYKSIGATPLSWLTLNELRALVRHYLTYRYIAQF